MASLPQRPRFDPVNRALIGGALLLVLCYVVVFTLTLGEWRSLSSILMDSLINVGALSLWAALSWWLNLRLVLSRPIVQQTLLHPILGFAFAVAWYFSVTVLLGWREGDFSGAFTVQPFSSVAFIWQAFQGLTVYALVVALAVIRRLMDALATNELQGDARSAPVSRGPGRLLVRSEDEFISVPIDDIVRIERAGDYAQLITTRGQHLTRKSLAELERQLPMERFVRVHRSHLIHLDALVSAESIGGGRMRAHLTGDMVVDTSRAGAKLLRERAS